MSVLFTDGPVEPLPEQRTASAAEDKSSQASAYEDKADSDKRSIDNSPFHDQFSEVEKAIANFTKHQPFNHHYAPNVNVNNNRHHHNGNHHHYNNNSNNHHTNNGGNRGNHHSNHHHNHYNNNNHYSNGNNNGTRLQPQTFTMNAQLKQQQQQQFLSSAAQQINNRYKSNNGGINQMVNVNSMSSNQPQQMGQVNGMSNMPGMNQMVNNSVNMVNTMPSHAAPQTQAYISQPFQQHSMVQQQMAHQQQTVPMGNGYLSSDLKFESFSQKPQPQLTHSDYITPLRNGSPQFSAPVRPVSVSAFGSPLEQINSNSSFGMNTGDLQLQSPMTIASSTGVIDGEYNKKLSMGESTYLGDIWGTGKGLRSSASVWA